VRHVGWLLLKPHAQTRAFRGTETSLRSPVKSQRYRRSLEPERLRTNENMAVQALANQLWDKNLVKNCTDIGDANPDIAGVSVGLRRSHPASR
jgi:hypothetical protein